LKEEENADEGGPILSLLEQRRINRDELYLKIEYDDKVEGSDESYSIVEYKNFFEACVEKKKYLPEGPIYYLDLESEP
jgi:intein/homing endonuclease